MKSQAFMLCIALSASPALAAPEVAAPRAPVNPATAGKPAPVQPGDPAAAAGQASAAEQAMMARWMKAMTPGPQHKMLESMAGSWKIATRMWMAPGQPPQTSVGTSKKTMILGGRYLQDHATSTMMGSPFEGIGMLGYDNVKGKFVSTWADSLGTMMMIATGTADARGKVITSTTEVWDPMLDKVVNARLVTTVVSPDKHTFEFYQPGHDGKETRTMEITYERMK